MLIGRVDGVKWRWWVSSMWSNNNNPKPKASNWVANRVYGNMHLSSECGYFLLIVKVFK